MDCYPVRIVSYEGENYQLHTKELEEILLNDEVKDKKVVIISIAGELRGGKSFMLNFFLRYLNAIGNESWLGEDDEPLKGFSWKNGPFSDTSGILLWNKPFIVTKSDGEKYAILLMDTQGTFDKYTGTKVNALLIAMSTLMSSVLILNMNRQVPELQLMMLQIFMSYGELASSKNDFNAKPFQKLQFLIRDWQNDYVFPFGFDGGKQYIDGILSVDNKNNNENLHQMRQYLRDCFESIDCCLLPHPGKKVSASKSFEGKLCDIDEDFVEQLKEYVPNVLSIDKLCPKKIDGRSITCLEAFEYFKAYFNVFRSSDTPAPNEIFQATVEGCFNATIRDCKLYYKSEMAKVINKESKYMSEKNFMTTHKRISEMALSKFKSAKKVGGRQFESEYVPKMNEELEEALETFTSLNEAKKNNSQVSRTAGVLIISYLLLYLVQQFIQMIGLQTLSTVLSIILYVLATMLLVWIGSIVLSRDEIRLNIEENINRVYDIIFVPFFKQAIEVLVKQTSPQPLSQK